MWAGSGQSAFSGDGGLAAEDAGLRAMAAPDAIADMQWGIDSLRSALIELRSTHSSLCLSLHPGIRRWAKSKIVGLLQHRR